MTFCARNKGSYICECHFGYNTLDDRVCHDVDECADNIGESLHGCHVDAKCINTDGSYECLCFDGFTGDTMTHHFCVDDSCCFKEMA